MVETNGAKWRQALVSLVDILTGNSEARDRSTVTDQILAQALAEKGHSGVSVGRFRNSLSKLGFDQFSLARPVVARTRQVINTRLNRKRSSIESAYPGINIERMTDAVNTFCYNPYVLETAKVEVPAVVAIEAMELVKPFLAQDTDEIATGAAITRAARQLYDCGHIKIMRRNGWGYIYI